MMMSYKFIIDAFTSPASLAAWLILLSSFSLISFVPVIVLFIKNKRGYFAALFLALIPLFIGLSGTMFSLRMAYMCIDNVPEVQRMQAMATGKSIALATSYFGILPAIVFWTAAVISFAFSSINNLTTAPNLKPGYVFTIYAKTRVLLLGITASCIPLLVGCAGWILGTMLKNDAIANVPAAQREAALVVGRKIVTNYTVAGLVLTVAGVLITFFLARGKSNS